MTAIDEFLNEGDWRLSYEHQWEYLGEGDPREAAAEYAELVEENIAATTNAKHELAIRIDVQRQLDALRAGIVDYQKAIDFQHNRATEAEREGCNLRAELDRATHDAELLQVATRHAQRNTDIEIQKNDHIRAELDEANKKIEQMERQLTGKYPEGTQE